MSNHTAGSSAYVTRLLPGPGVASLRAAGIAVDYHDVDESPPRDELLAHVLGKHAVVAMLTECFDAEAMDAAGPQLKVIANVAVGFDNIDVPAATARGITVTNTPDVLTEATADLAWMLILAAARRVIEGDELVRSGEWRGWGPMQLLGAPIHGRTLGILGMGHIGAAVARRAQGFALPVIYHNRSRRRGLEEALGARFVSLDELVATSDVLSLHAPLNEQSRHVIDAEVLARMKSSAILINTARGALIDESALVDALANRGIAAAGLDVYEREPALTAGLTDLKNVVLLPHIGSATTEARGAMAQLGCDNVVAVLGGRPPLTPVNL